MIAAADALAAATLYGSLLAVALIGAAIERFNRRRTVGRRRERDR